MSRGDERIPLGWIYSALIRIVYALLRGKDCKSNLLRTWHKLLHGSDKSCDRWIIGLGPFIFCGRRNRGARTPRPPPRDRRKREKSDSQRNRNDESWLRQHGVNPLGRANVQGYQPSRDQPCVSEPRGEIRPRSHRPHPARVHNHIRTAN